MVTYRGWCCTYFLPVSAKGLMWLSDSGSPWKKKTHTMAMLWGRSTGYLKPFFASDFFSMLCFFGLELQLLRVAWLPERRWVHGGDRKHVSAMGLWLILLGAGLSGVEFHSFNLGTRTHTSSLFHLLKFKNYWRFTRLWKCQNGTGTEMLPMVLHCLTPADFSCVRTSLSIIPSKKKVGVEKTVKKCSSLRGYLHLLKRQGSSGL